MSSTVNLTAAFKDFLFASVGEDRNDMPLSVVSTLARLNLDPWAEAAELALMSADGATRRLSLLLAEVSDGPSNEPDRETVAARLVSLLPAMAKTGAPAAWPAIGDTSAPPLRSVWIMSLLMLASTAISLIIETRAADRGVSRQASRPATSTSTPPDKVPR